MRYCKTNEGVFQGILISGPRHNLLGLVFSLDQSKSKLIVEEMKHLSKDKLLFESDAVITEVLAGLADANQSLQTNYQLSKIQYVGDDTPPTSQYRELAMKITTRQHHQSGNYEGSH